MSCNNFGRVHGLVNSHSKLVLQLIADILSVACTDVLDELLPLRSNLICGRFLTVVKHVGAKSGAKTSL